MSVIVSGSRLFSFGVGTNFGPQIPSHTRNYGDFSEEVQ